MNTLVCGVAEGQQVAITECGAPSYPAYINARHILAGTCTPEVFVVTVRSRGAQVASEITLSRTELEGFARSLLSTLGVAS